MTSTLDVKDMGAGSPVLLLHGCPSSTRHFRPLVEGLSTSMRVLVPELPGYGGSAQLEGNYSLARVGELLERELAARGITEVAIVGHSAGAYHAFALALSGRISVTRVVSLAGMAGYDAPVRAAFRQFAGMVREGHDLRPGWLARMASPGFEESDPAGAAEVMSWILAAPAAVLADELDAFAEAEDLRPRLRDLAIPILARVGARDEAVPIAFSQDIVKNAPRARLQVVAGCGHALLHEDRRATVEAVVTWLQQ